MGGNVNTTYKYGDEEFQIDRTDRLSIVVKDKENIVRLRLIELKTMTSAERTAGEPGIQAWTKHCSTRVAF